MRFVIPIFSRPMHVHIRVHSCSSGVCHRSYQRFIRRCFQTSERRLPPAPKKFREDWTRGNLRRFSFPSLLYTVLQIRLKPKTPALFQMSRNLSLYDLLPKFEKPPSLMLWNDFSIHCRKGSNVFLCEGDEGTSVKSRTKWEETAPRIWRRLEKKKGILKSELYWKRG